MTVARTVVQTSMKQVISRKLASEEFDSLYPGTI